MSAQAQANGWHGFAGLGTPVKGGHLYVCDGMPRLNGCGNETITTRPLAKVGTKKSGWLVCYGEDFDGTPDTDVVLTFCPECAAVVKAQASAS